MYAFGVKLTVDPGASPWFSRIFLVNWGLLFSPLRKIIVGPVFPAVEPVHTTVILTRLKNKAMSVNYKRVRKDIEIKGKRSWTKTQNTPISYHGFIFLNSLRQSHANIQRHLTRGTFHQDLRWKIQSIPQMYFPSCDKFQCSYLSAGKSKSQRVYAINIAVRGLCSCSLQLLPATFALPSWWCWQLHLGGGIPRQLPWRWRLAKLVF